MGPILHIGFISGAPGPAEIILVFLVVLLLFGPRKLPEFARTVGSLMQQLRRASNDFKDQLMRVDEDIQSEARTVFEEDEPDLTSEPSDDTHDAPSEVSVDSDESEEGRPLAG
jgi:TatA/E family protein of Tat protein translocase